MVIHSPVASTRAAADVLDVLELKLRYAHTPELRRDLVTTIETYQRHPSLLEQAARQQSDE